MPPKTRASTPARSAAAPGFFQRHPNVFVYVPNLIGYARVALASAALAWAFTDVPFALCAYFLSFVCDELDGRFARMFDQCSEFGKLLDMVTDRLATAGLLMVLSSKFPRWFWVTLQLLLIDVASHWLQMYTSLLSAKKSHKDVSKNANVVLRLYYTNRAFMGVCCVSAEVLYLCALALSDATIANVNGVNVFANALPKTLSVSVPALPFLPVSCGLAVAKTITVITLNRASLATQIAVLTIPGWLVKQWTNVASLAEACVALVEFDFPKGKEKENNRKKR
jgi:CDP-diacylglycerol--inositol 3-phosphatidyltransferase